jgi:hypothetical protein
VIFCQHCVTWAPVISIPCLIEMRKAANEKKYRAMFEQTLRTEFPELGSQPLTDEQVAIYTQKLRRRNQRRQRHRNWNPEPPPNEAA